VAGYRLLNDDASWAEVVSVAVVDAPLLAFNLTVEGFHTYFVAADEGAAPVNRITQSFPIQV
jgi:filamentous hemagglutinin